ncbi:MAG: hemerythrin domain-containing protein [Gammaproteobacteria bacterium]|nr:hemerythrin domain-containing protein [Gammaproteobacteria bacterium]MDH3372153.1 hemerythrin domain-containing protein [Gammaproteobacteria bacterium]MDH3408828.1 hemerythrin domain-containing protein [Gammaproteobacteria bacterium]MDH3553872.1 hemerythrin domain-containing protein [Gammaproteobacteria bacterium]
MTMPAIEFPNAIIALRDEHRYMGLLLTTLEEQLESEELSAREGYFLMQDIVRYMHEYPDTEHHPTEDLMFEKLVRRNPAREMDVARLRREHVMLRENTADMLELLDNAAKRRTPKAIKALRVACSDYIDRLRQHMQFEEAELFPSAVRCLAHKDWHAIDRRLESTQDPLFGPTVQHDYRVLYEYFANRAAQVSQQMTHYGFLQLDNMILSADAVEAGIAEIWEMLLGHADSLAQELRVVANKSFDGRSLISAITVQSAYAGFVGKTACQVGSKAARIYYKTLRDAVVFFFKGTQ